MKFFITRIVYVTLFSVPLFSSAQESWCDTEKPHPIDIKFAKDLDKDGSTTIGMRNAQSAAHEKWGQLIEHLYAQLYGLLPKEDASFLKKSEMAWRNFEDAQRDWLWSDSMYGNSGTSGPVNVSSYYLELNRQRACDLNNFLEQVKLNQDND